MKFCEARVSNYVDIRFNVSVKSVKNFFVGVDSRYFFNMNLFINVIYRTYYKHTVS